MKRFTLYLTALVLLVAGCAKIGPGPDDISGCTFVRAFLAVHGFLFDLSTPERLLGEIEFLNDDFETVSAAFVTAETTGIAMRKKLKDVR